VVVAADELAFIAGGSLAPHRRNGVPLRR
jgi:hypothetical protein